MQRILALALGALLAAGACSLDTEGTGTGNPGETGGNSGDTGVGGGGLGGSSASGGSGGASCFPGPGEKLCGTNCVSTNDPAYGCAVQACTPCNVPRAVAACDGDGRCGVGSCFDGYADCNGVSLDGCEADIYNDPKNCGGCNHDCAAGTVGEQFVCNNGVCEVSQCPLGHEDCDGNPDNGCEVDLNLDAGNCGYCTNRCELANAGAKCEAGQCRIASCDPTWYDCNGQPADGCEKNTAIDPANCGLCATQCPGGGINGSIAICAGGVCGLQCVGAWANCDNNLTTGCETDTSRALAHCGGCGRACSGANGTPSCGGGNCSISCSGGWGDCDNNPRRNGCETNLDTSTAHCGSCGSACSNNHGTPSCSGGSCSISCSSGYGDCSGGVANGCETSLNTTNNCGSCGKVCDATHGTPGCNNGNCTISCSSGWRNCDGNVNNGCERSVTTLTDCGACNVACTNAHGTTACNGGSCSPSCANGWADCDGNANNGCETDITTTSNCGSCGVTCTNAHGSTACSGGACNPSCAGGWADCDGNKRNGCETGIDSNVSNCGGCGQACSSAHGTASCSSGQCSISCDSNWGDCDNNVDNGCETDLLTTKSDCNSCGNSCPGNQTCTNGACG